MANVADNVRVAVTGSVYYAPSGTALPTEIDGVLNVAFKDVGYVTEDGITESTSTDTNDITAWQNGDVVRRVQTSHAVSYQLTLLETNEATLALFYGNYDETDDVVEVGSGQAFRGAWVIDIVDGADESRFVIPDGQITEKGDVTYANGDAVAYPITITCYADSSGVKAYKYYTDPTA